MCIGMMGMASLMEDRGRSGDGVEVDKLARWRGQQGVRSLRRRRVQATNAGSNARHHSLIAS